MVKVLNVSFWVRNHFKHGDPVAYVAGMTTTFEKLPEAKITISAIANRDYPQQHCLIIPENHGEHSRSPLVWHFGEILTGLITILASRRLSGVAVIPATEATWPPCLMQFPTPKFALSTVTTETLITVHSRNRFLNVESQIP